MREAFRYSIIFGGFWEEEPRGQELWGKEQRAEQWPPQFVSPAPAGSTSRRSSCHSAPLCEEKRSRQRDGDIAMREAERKSPTGTTRSYEPVDNPWFIDLTQRCHAGPKKKQWKYHSFFSTLTSILNLPRRSSKTVMYSSIQI